MRGAALRCLPALAALAACEPFEDTGEAECYGHWTEPVEAEVRAAADAPGGVALAVSPVVDLPGATEVTGVELALRVTSLHPREDCVVGLYFSDTPPAPDALPELPDGASPPEWIEGLGERVGAVSLARHAATTPDQEAFWLELSAETGGYLTVAGCAGARLDVWAEATVGVCTTDWEAIPEGLAPVALLW